MLDLEEISKRPKLHPNTLRQCAKDVTLPSVKFRKIWRIEKKVTPAGSEMKDRKSVV